MSASGQCNASADCSNGIFDDDVVRFCYKTAAYSDLTEFCDLKHL